MNLYKLGWNTNLEHTFNQYQKAGFHTGRISAEYRGQYRVFTECGELTAEVAGKLLYSVSSPSQLPKTGDWVVIMIFNEEKKAIIHGVLPRKTEFSRKVAGKKTNQQVIATNIDIIFVVQGLDGNFNIPRLERYLVMVKQGGAEPVILLNKKDLCVNSHKYVSQIKKIFSDIPVIQVSAKTGEDLQEVTSFIGETSTAAFIGSSGVGKSTLINKLVGKSVQKTEPVRDKDSRGRHITAARELFILPNGGLVIDTPGMRELQLWTADEGMEDIYHDIKMLAEKCRFSDCTHTRETKCAVRQAVGKGEISEVHYKNYLKLQTELAWLDDRKEQVFQGKKKWEKEIAREMKRFKKMNPKGNI